MANAAKAPWKPQQAQCGVPGVSCQAECGSPVLNPWVVELHKPIKGCLAMPSPTRQWQQHIRAAPALSPLPSSCQGWIHKGGKGPVHQAQILLLNRAKVNQNQPCEKAVENVLQTHQMVIQITSRCKKALNRELCIEMRFCRIYKYI